MQIRSNARANNLGFAAVLTLSMFVLASTTTAFPRDRDKGGSAVWRDGHRTIFGQKERDRYLVAGTGPDYPYEARRSKLIGSGRYEMQIAQSGEVIKVVVLKSAGIRMLDQAAVTAFGEWHFKPGIFLRVEIPVTWENPRVAR